MAIAILSYLVVVGAHVALVMLVAHFPSWAVPAYVVMLTALFASGLVLRTRTRLPENKAAASTDRDAVLLGIWVVGWVGFLVWFAHDVYPARHAVSAAFPPAFASVAASVESSRVVLGGHSAVLHSQTQKSFTVRTVDPSSSTPRTLAVQNGPGTFVVVDTLPPIRSFNLPHVLHAEAQSEEAFWANDFYEPDVQVVKGARQCGPIRQNLFH